MKYGSNPIGSDMHDGDEEYIEYFNRKTRRLRDLFENCKLISVSAFKKIGC
jgi:hypothetical protein